jgi:aqualysin 1
MKKLLVISSILLACILSGNVVPQHSSAKGTKFKRSVDAIAGRYIVVFNQQPTKGQLEFANNTESLAYELAGSHGAYVDRVFDTALSGFSAEMTEEAAIRLSNDERVAFVEEDAVAYATGNQSNATWGLDRLDQRALPLNAAFQYATTGSGVHAYVVDSGIRITHQEFGGRATVGADFVGDGQNGLDCYGHGTHVAGTIGSSTYGVAKNVSLHSVRVLGCSGTGTVSAIISAANWITANRMNPAVANISVILSGGSSSLDLAITNSIASGVTYTVASGNNGGNACNYSPARIPNAITVGAADSNDARPPFSNQGSCVDIYAPGSGVLSLSNADDTSTRWMSGTSMAAPHAAGVAALYLESNPGASASTVSQQVLNSSTLGLVTNTDGTGPNRLLYSWLGGSTPPALPAHVTIIKQVIDANGGTSSSTVFGYTATNLGANSFALVDNNAPPSDRFENPNVIPGEGTDSDIVVTESSISGWNLNSIQCTETSDMGTSSVQNTTVDVTNRRAIIKAEQGESVTCTFTSQEVAPTAAPVTVSGRVVGFNGRGLKSVTVAAQDMNTGLTYYAVTNSFGYYTFNGLLTTHYYTISARSKRYEFTPATQSFSLSEALTSVNFVGTN